MTQDNTAKFQARIPPALGKIRERQTEIPRIAKDPRLVSQIEQALRGIPTTHDLHLGDARELSGLNDESVHLVVTSPPYWTLKEYRRAKGQLGHVVDYAEFLSDLDRVWTHCFRALKGC